MSHQTCLPGNGTGGVHDFFSVPIPPTFPLGLPLPIPAPNSFNISTSVLELDPSPDVEDVEEECKAGGGGAIAGKEIETVDVEDCVEAGRVVEAAMADVEPIEEPEEIKTEGWDDGLGRVGGRPGMRCGRGGDVDEANVGVEDGVADVARVEVDDEEMLVMEMESLKLLCCCRCQLMLLPLTLRKLQLQAPVVVVACIDANDEVGVDDIGSVVGGVGGVT
ncbi:hypothetical protein M422DRAFT_260352 [Sphaerobolus stellatus SS14]|uniref:Uncharacterized protein n=1 Tax=Sphaerobolus stellatus (strain SS14) TaxID=990650 RepID=A0A0C9U2U9_SPHS4|nr:hypothetical protein M422DRAFT_260352 [Sphaerobolus stellatus SS14]